MIRRLSSALVLAGGMIATAAILRTLQRTGSIDPVTAKRAIQVLIGLMLAVYANGTAKDIGRWTSAESAARTQSALRLGGWSLTLAGLGYAALWAYTPTAFADVAGTVLVASATLITAAYAAWMFFACRVPRRA